MSDPLAALDLTRCEALISRARDGDAQAWRELAKDLWPHLLGLARANRTLVLSGGRSEDRAHDVAAAVLGKLGGAGGRGLGLFGPWRQRHGDKTLADWIRIVTKNVLRDQARDELGAIPRSADTEHARDPSVKRLLNDFATSPALESRGFRPPFTTAQTARQLLDFARAQLPVDQYAALTRWVDGVSFADVGVEMGVVEAEARKLVRAAVATLRRHFVTDHEAT